MAADSPRQFHLPPPRRPFLGALAIILLMAAALLVYQIATFDLNRHRERLQQALSTMLERPVTLGAAHLSLRHGLSLAVSEVLIPPAPGAAWNLQAGGIFARLKLLPLLQGELRFSRLVLDSPELHLTLGPDTPPGPLDFKWGKGGVRTLILREGVLSLTDRRDPQRPLQIIARDLSGRLTGLGGERPARIDLRGSLQQADTPADFKITGTLAPPGSNRPAAQKLQLTVDRLDPAPLLGRYIPAATKAGGTLDLQAEAVGTPASGLQFRLELAGDGLTLQPPGYRHPLPIATLRAGGTWTAGEMGNRLTGITLEADELACRGDLSWWRQEGELFLRGSLTTPPLPIPALLRLMPDRWSAPLQSTTRGGRLEVTALEYAGPASVLHTPGESLPLNAQIRINELSFEPRPQAGWQGISMQLSLADDLLQVDQGEATGFGSRFQFAGTVERPFGPAAEVTAELGGRPDLGQLVAAFADLQPKGLTAQGAVPIDLQVSGPPSRLLIDLRANLTAAAAAWGEIEKPAGQPASLLAAGTLTPGRLELSHARLLLPPLELRGRGDLAFQEKGGAYSFAVDAAGFSLEEAGERVPLLAKLQATGEIDLHLELAGEGGKLQRREGIFRLHGVGLHLARAIADLRQVDGTVRLSGNRIDIERLSARLGSSPLVVEGEIDDLREPEARLRVRGRSIRADELIFSSPRALLRDVDGTLRISRQGIVFDPVKVRLDGGTRAVVNGEVRLAPAPVVELDIAAPYGNIDEVIALWEKPEGDVGQERGGGEKSALRVRIAARAAEADLAGVRFQQAEGEIHWEDHVLTIHPLRFRIGEGGGTGIVILDAHAHPSLLRVSGHVEEIDAAVIHRQLLKKRGLVSGRMQGDFYLEGRIGENFLQTSLGGFHLEVHDGVLRRFKSLARVFSLLNVSQIFALQLPDMARGGMPFERLTATFSLERGILATDDLLVDSNAMNLSLVGQADLVADELDFVLGVKPLRTVDKIVTRIPVAGWILAGEEKALVTAHFTVRGPGEDPRVVPVPITSVSEKVVGIFRRVFGLPGKMIDMAGELVEGN